MSWIEIILIGAGLSLDVFAYALCRGAVVGEMTKKAWCSGRRVHALESDQPDGWKFCGKDTGLFQKMQSMRPMTGNIYRLRFFLDWAFISSSKRQEEKK